MSTKRLWFLLGTVLLGAFTLLGFFGRDVYRQAPPIPDRVVTQAGRLLFDRDSILEGQQVWQSIGGQQVGTVWGHGAYQAPDWSADWLHREPMALLDAWALVWFIVGLKTGWSVRAPSITTKADPAIAAA